MKVSAQLYFQGLSDQQPTNTLNTLLVAPAHMDTVTWIKQAWRKSPHQVNANIVTKQTTIWMPATQ
jgi:hypothetical protein